MPLIPQESQAIRRIFRVLNVPQEDHTRFLQSYEILRNTYRLSCPTGTNERDMVLHCLHSLGLTSNQEIVNIITEAVASDTIDSFREVFNPDLISWAKTRAIEIQKQSYKRGLRHCFNRLLITMNLPVRIPNGQSIPFIIQESDLPQHNRKVLRLALKFKLQENCYRFNCLLSILVRENRDIVNEVIEEFQEHWDVILHDNLDISLTHKNSQSIEQEFFDRQESTPFDPESHRRFLDSEFFDRY